MLTAFFTFVKNDYICIIIKHKNTNSHNFMQKLIYIHGLHSSSKQSSKFKVLSENFDNVQAFDWTIDDEHIAQRLQELAYELADSKDDITIIGDSTGANFAIQLREMMYNESKYSYAKLVLISPLLALSDLRDTSIMPTNIGNQLLDVKDIDDALVFIALEDEVVKHRTKTTLRRIRMEVKKDVHAFKSFPEHIRTVEHYIDSMYL